MKKVLLILIPVIICFFILAQVDDDLSEEATELVNRIELEEVSNAYLYKILIPLSIVNLWY